MEHPLAHRQPGVSFPYQYKSACYAVGIVFPILGLILLVARFVARRKQINKKASNGGYGLDDLLALLSWLSLLAMSAAWCYGVAHGAFGSNAPPPPQIVLNDIEALRNWTPHIVVLQSYYEYIYTIPLCITLAFTKLTILFFYRRLFVTHKWSKFDTVNWIVIALCGAWVVAFVLYIAIACKHNLPNITTMEFRYLTGVCTARSAAAGEKALAVSDFILDLFVLVLPLPVIWRLQLGLAAKLSTTLILLLGSMSVFASAVRVVVYFQALDVHSVATYSDQILLITLPLYWAFVEAGLAFLAAQLPSLSILFRGLSAKKMLKSFPWSSSAKLDSSRDNTGERGPDMHETSNERLAPSPLPAPGPLGSAARSGSMPRGECSARDSVAMAVGEDPRRMHGADDYV